MKRSLKSRALQLLAQREQSRVELRRKLLAHVTDGACASVSEAEPARPAASDGSDSPTAPVDVEAQVDAVLDWLERQRFLSAARFAESRIHARAPRFGNRRICAELARHAVEIPAEAKQALVESELTRARSVHSRKFGAAPTTPAEYARQARFLAARGFSSDVIRHALRAPGRTEAVGPRREEQDR